jgi:F420-dependent oxidoreductase-like protein
MDDPRQLPAPCLVVLVGPSAAGKSTWAAAHFAPDEIVSSDRLRAVVGHGPDDLDASDDAFALLDTIVAARLGRRLTTVVDTLGLDPQRRRAYRELADRHGVACAAVAFDVPAAELRVRNRSRARPVPADALRAQVTRWSAARAELAGEGFATVLSPVAVRAVPAHLAASAPRTAAQRERPVGLRFGLHVSAFPWTDTAAGLRATAVAAEAAGFESLWVMDHVRQIPQVGRDWDPMLESYGTLGWLAALTSSVRLGALVTPVTFRNVAHLAKIIATLDVLSGGRMTCGLGLGWYEREHVAYGWPFPPRRARYELLEDALQALPLLWGKGSPAFEGRRMSVPEAICYPRPVQEHVPVLVGGGGERRTLRLAARYADAVNVMGDAGTVRHKVEVLAAHCGDTDRPVSAIEVTHLSTALLGGNAEEVRALVERLRPRRAPPDRYAAGANAGTVEDQVGRFRLLADAGVHHAIISLPNLGIEEPHVAVGRWAPVIEAFRHQTPLDLKHT